MRCGEPKEFCWDRKHSFNWEFGHKPHYTSKYLLIEFYEGQYTIKSGYYVTKNILKHWNEVIYSELSITKLHLES